MKQLILDVLEDVSTGQPNLESKGVREMVANTIMAAIKSEGWFLDLGFKDMNKTAEKYAEACEVSDKEKERAKWVCKICGKNTFEVDFDYIGSEYNHLGCELEIEMAEDRRKKMKDNQNETK